MKVFAAVAVFIWLVCGLAGAWMLDGPDLRWQSIVRGPITLVRAFNETPPSLQDG